ncbi:hypothetical protein CA850_16795 [Micromonospora echinospora]|uniref:Uncharacterized protein n=1 Tax=Micromonospora echinospora TaxID=1877 RepID=A0A1C4WUB3_MICEC|nr:hypothetical protein [Micromonospora echinospora]OZV79727.1 hypothetical protein CA850_16795 [Micromonospora echinospora]SCE99733.1 hypothetical protein GA0070618_2496 [Micromonospora echinospora]
MDSHAEGRSRTGWLAGLTVVAMLASAGWWTSADPGATPGAAMAPRADLVLRAGAASGAASVRAEPPRTGEGARAVVDPATGAVLYLPERYPSGSRVTIDPSSGRVVGFRPGDSEDSSSRLGTVVWREHRLLTDNVREVRRQSATEPGVRYQLLVICDGGDAGDLQVRMGIGRRWDGQRSAGCDGSLYSMGVVAAGGTLSVRIAHPQVGAVELTAMLVALD